MNVAVVGSIGRQKKYYNQYGQYLKDVMDGKYQEHLY